MLHFNSDDDILANMKADNGRKTLTVESALHAKVKAMSKATGMKIAALADKLIAEALKARNGSKAA